MRRTILANGPGERYVLLETHDGRTLIAPEAEWYRWRPYGSRVLAAGMLEAMGHARHLLAPSDADPLITSIAIAEVAP